MTEPSTATVLIAAITTVPPTLVALASLLQGRRNGAKADAISAKADAIGVKTDAAEQKVAAVHIATESLGKQATEIKKQTDGQLSTLIERVKEEHEENQQLREMITQLMSIMAARDGATIQVRATDNAPDVMKAPKPGNGDMMRERRGDRRKKDGGDSE